jgi:hypothetical protein
MSDLTLDDLIAEEQIVLRFTPEDLRGLYLLHYLAFEALVHRGVHGIDWTDYQVALDAIVGLRDRVECEVADQRSAVWNGAWQEAARTP